MMGLGHPAESREDSHDAAMEDWTVTARTCSVSFLKLHRRAKKLAHDIARDGLFLDRHVYARDTAEGGTHLGHLSHEGSLTLPLQSRRRRFCWLVRHLC